MKPHGIRGDVIVELVSDVVERLAPGTVLATRGATGPLEVVASRPHQHRFIVTFDGVVGREGAEALRGVALLAPPMDDPDALWVHELIGCSVIDVDGTVHGTVLSVEANPASDLLVLEGQRLVPIRFVVDASRPGELVVELPAGLFDL